MSSNSMTDNAVRKKRKLNHVTFNNSDSKLRVKMWIKYAVKLPQYLDILIDEGYDDLQTIEQKLTKEDLVSIGVEEEAHRSKIMLFVQRLKAKNKKIIAVT